MEYWTKLTPIHDEIYALLIAVLAGLALQLFRLRADVVYGRTGNSFNTITPDDQEISIYTETTQIVNKGRAPATDLRVTFRGKPDSISVYPEQVFYQKDTSRGHHQINFANIPPKGALIITHLSINGSAGQVEAVLCKETVPKPIPFWSVRQYGPIGNTFFAVLGLCGFAFIVQFVVSVVGS